ncbi:HYR domain-containing protein [Mesorhizobium sp. AR10]|uniref:HYR domain-containing protein n=1 Tax=Mesorhizobium sp. AR10 TaxID=2865839 RepID=UPI00215E4930|nr:HYR domain-containing protein [Mesorhizobium sp. AR10]UVK37536.1 HYR domain-containing protein [Mesorhizobium sp. AR10]
MASNSVGSVARTAPFQTRVCKGTVDLAARLAVGLFACLALWVASAGEGHAQSSSPSISVASSPTQFRFVGQVMKLTYTVYTGNKVFSTVSIDPRGFGPVVPTCPSPPQETGATFTCTGTYTVTPLNMASGTFSGAPIVRWQNGNKTGANVFVPIAPPESNPPNLTLPANIVVNTDPGLATAIVDYAVSANDPEDTVADLLLTDGPASHSAFALGTTMVSYSATDPSGNATTGSFTVTVEDHEAPVVTLPAPITDNAPAGAAGKAVAFAATATDNVDANPTVSCAPASGSTFSIGETTVSCTATDQAGNTSDATTFKVTVNDVTAPDLTLPADISVNTDPGMATATVTYSATATDAGDPAPVVGCLPASGSAFAVGENTVSCTATDASNNVAGPLTFKVTVADHEAPVLTPPANITVNTDAGVSSAVVTFANGTAVDNVDGNLAPVVATGSLASGSTFPLGTTTIVLNATDAAGNTGTASFTVTVQDKEAPAFTAPADISVAAATGQSSAPVTYATPTATDNVTVNPPVSCLPASGSNFAFGETTVSCSSTDAATNTTTKTFKVTVTDGEAPALSLPSNVVAGTAPGATTATVTYPAPTATDVIDPNPTVSCSPASGSSFNLGPTTVDCTARDASGNTASGSFTVTIEDKEAPALTLPGDITATAATGSNAATVSFTATASDNVDGAVAVTCNPASGSSFTFGETTVACGATDVAGNIANGSFKVTVTDGEAPTLSLPANISVDTDAGKATAKVSYAVSASDAVDGTVTPQLVAGLASGSNFPVGTTTVTYKATDAQGNSSGGSFTVTVSDREAPVVNVPANITVSAEAGKNTATVVYSVSATDAVDGALAPTQTAGLASGASFPVGTTSQTFRAIDSHGNIGRASFTVTVVDGEAPEVTVPANIIVDTDPGKATAHVTYTVSASDVVDGPVTAQLVAGLASGSDFPVGVTTIAYKATDRQGNVSDPKSFTVTVRDNEAPVLTVPANISISTDAGKATAHVIYAVSATDLVDGAVTPKLVAGLASGSDFPLGTTTVTYKATDNQGNASAEQSFTVTVVDGEPPVLTVPGNIGITVAYGETAGTASWSAPTATDNAPGVTITQTTGLASGSSFPLGTTTNTFEARDVAGNTVTASFTVTVSANPPGNVTFIVNSPVGGSFGFSSPEPALNVAVNSSGGRGSSGAIALAPGTYSFAFSVPGGAGISSAQCSDAGSSINAGTRSGTLKVVSGGAVSCTISTSDSAEKAVALIGSFLEGRAEIIVNNQPDIDRRIERLTGAYSGNGGVSAFGMPIGSQLPVGVQISSDQTTFAYSMQRARAGAAEPQTAAAAGSDSQPSAGQIPVSAYLPSGQNPASGADAVFQHSFGPTAGTDAAPAADPMSKRFDVWAEGTIGRFNSAGGDGSFGIANTGADYLLTPNLLLGLGLQVDWTDQDGKDGAKISGIGYLLGPYATARLTDNLYLDARAGWGQSFNQISPLGTFEDKFDGNRWLATIGLIGTFDIDRWKIKPEARVTMFEEKADAYVDGLGVDVPSVDVRTGQFAFGPTISTTVALENGLQMTPFVELQGIWTFMQHNSATAATETPGLAETGLRGRAETGLELSAGNGMSINASAFYDGLGSSGYNSWGGKLGLSQRF